MHDLMVLLTGIVVGGVCVCPLYAAWKATSEANSRHDDDLADERSNP